MPDVANFHTDVVGNAKADRNVVPSLQGPSLTLFYLQGSPRASACPGPALAEQSIAKHQPAHVLLKQTL